TGINKTLKTKKLNPRYIKPFQIIKKIGLVTYQITLPPYLSNLHNIFHISQLKKYIPDKNHILQPETVQLQNDLTYQTSPVQIVKKSNKQLRDKTLRLIKIA
ncbi:hypothetical protein DF186_14405, partial [Enterococcus hirae]